MDLTLCLIVKNEERKLSKSIESFRGLYSELVIVDTGSRDKTKKIAEQIGARVYDFSFNDNFAEARNFALSKAGTTWTMMIDADDRIKAADLKKLRDYINKIPSNIAGVMLPYLLPSLHSGHIKTYKPRIWKTSLELRYRLPVHEYLDIPENFLARFQRLEVPIYHSTAARKHQKHLLNYIPLLLTAYENNHNDNRVLFYLGHDFHFSGQINNAIIWYQKFIDLQSKNADELNRVLFWKGCCHHELGQELAAEESLLKAIRANANFIEPYIWLGDFYSREKLFEKAFRYYLMAAKCVIPKTHVFFNPDLYQGVAQKRIETLVNRMQ